MLDWIFSRYAPCSGSMSKRRTEKPRLRGRRQTHVRHCLPQILFFRSSSAVPPSDRIPFQKFPLCFPFSRNAAVFSKLRANFYPWGPDTVSPFSPLGLSCFPVLTSAHSSNVLPLVSGPRNHIIRTPVTKTAANIIQIARY